MLGVGGWSYGAVLTNALIALNQRFKAAVSGAVASNMYAMYVHDQYIREYELELGQLWCNRGVYDRVSFPFLQADRIKTPTLFQCAQQDFNVPGLGSEQMYQALRSLDVPTQLVICPQGKSRADNSQLFAGSTGAQPGVVRPLSGRNSPLSWLRRGSCSPAP